MLLQHGSGKTAVLVERMIQKIIKDKIDIDSILIVTFTNAAASEMKERILEAIYKKIEENPEDSHLQRQITLLNKANISTIHSFCLEVIKNNFFEIDISPNFRIGESSEIELLKMDVLDELFEEKYNLGDKDFLELVETYSSYRGDDDLRTLVLDIYKFIQSSPFPNEWLEKAVEKDTENTTAKVCLALSYQALDKNDLAYAQFNAIFKDEPNLNSLRFDYANLLADMSKDDDAIIEFKKYAEFYPNDARVYKNMGIVYERKKDYQNAIANYEKALTLDTKDNDTKKSLASCYHYQKDYINAIKYYDELLANNPDDIDVLTNKALALHASKKYEEAIALYNEVLETKSSELVQNNLTDALIALGQQELIKQNYSKATDTFIKAISRGTKDSGAYFGLARAYRACNVNDKATEYYEKAIAMNPEKVEYSNEFAEFISEINSVKDDKTSSNGEIQSIVISDGVQEVNSQTNKDFIAKGDDFYKAKKYDESLKNYKDALVLNPSDEVTLLKIGNVYKLKNDEKNAIDFYKKSIFVNPEYADGWFNLGLVYANENDVSESKKCFQKAISIDKEYAYAYYALAVAYEKEKNNADAIKNYELFLKYNKDQSAVEAVQTRIKSLKK